MASVLATCRRRAVGAVLGAALPARDGKAVIGALVVATDRRVVGYYAMRHLFGREHDLFVSEATGLVWQVAGVDVGVGGACPKCRPPGIDPWDGEVAARAAPMSANR